MCVKTNIEDKHNHNRLISTLVSTASIAVLANEHGGGGGGARNGSGGLI